MSKRSTALFVVVFCSLHCGQLESALPAQHEQALSGAEVTAEQPAVGALVMDSGEKCTATLIAPQFILTAAHCVKGPGTFRTSQDIDRRTIASRVHPLAGQPSMVDSDLAVVQLASSSVLPPAALATNPLAINEPVALFGYGRNEIGAADVKRKAVTTIASTRGPLISLPAAGPNACAGDSGGPAFNSSGQLAAVISSGGAQCGGATQLTQLAPYRQWVLGVLGLGFDDEPPTTSLLRPGSNATMPVSFRATGSAADSEGVVLFEWRVDGTLVSQQVATSAQSMVELSIEPGAHQLEFTAVDGFNNRGSSLIELTIVGPTVEPRTPGAPCWDATDCNEGSCEPSNGSRTCGAAEKRGCSTTSFTGFMGLLALWVLRRGKRA